ncbi:MAG: efflux RND transporter periplasmic adaptor subunit [Pirellulales bacterium]|nr:efflux RND transporter periplasmic adaptor subunit [Pirellulales bacterium]
MRWYSLYVRYRRWVLVACFSLIGGAILFLTLRNLPARDLTKAAGEGSSSSAAAERSGKANLGYANGGNSPERPGQTDPYRTTGVEVVEHFKTLRVTGSLAADELSNVASNVNGIVVEVRVDRGSVVRRGDVMVQLDPTDPQNKLSEGMALVEELKAKLSLDESKPFVAEELPEVKLAKAAWDLAISRRKRAEDLLPQKAISLDDCEQIRAESEIAEQRYQQAILQVKQTYQSYKTNVAKLAAMRKAVADTTIAAPFDGVVVEKHVALGEQVTGGFIASKVVTVVKTSPLRISLTVPQQHIARIKPGQKAIFQVDSFPEKKFAGEIRYISPSVTSDTRSLVVEAITPNAEGILRPGLFVTAELELPEQHKQFFVPAAAVEKMGESARVFVVREGGAREQVVALGKRKNDLIEITAGLQGNERIVCNPAQVREGAQARK